MYIINTTKMPEIVDELKSEFQEHEFKSIESLPEMSAEDKAAVEVLITHDSRIDEAFINECPNLKYLAWYAAGINNLPLDALKSRGIILTNARGVHKIQISEYIISYIMTDYKNVLPYYKHQQDHGFKTKIRHRELNGETICFIGTGEIPQHTALLCKAFNMNVTGINTNGRMVDGFVKTFPIDERQNAFKEANIIVNVLPSTPETTDLLTIDDFKAMGEDALFINVGRGTVVEEPVLVKVLKEKIIRKAAVDVYYKEPIDENNPLYELNNIIMTPHITGNSVHYNRRATEILKENLKTGIEHYEDFVNLIDYDKGY